MYSEYSLMLPLTICLAGVVGLFVGSFLNVVVYRTPLGLSVSAPRSFCPTCDRQLAWWENVPVASWLGLRGRCRTCHEAISIRYPLVELATGVAFAVTTWAWHGTILAAAYCVLAASMVAVGLIEYGGRRAPLPVAAVGVGLAQTIIVVGGAWQHRWTVVAGSVAGTAAALAVCGLLHTDDPDARDDRWHGRSGLVLVGCWAGGLGLTATTVAVSSGMVTYLACMVGARATARSAVSAGGAPMAPARRLHPVLETPLVTAIVVAMVASLAVGVR
jgi:leader peptidase (prepilin peptidase) / N-methyltransferase